MGSALLSSRGSTRPLIGLGRIDSELSEELSGDGVDHSHVKVIDEDQNAGSRVGSPDADLDESTAVTDRDLAGSIDPITTNAVVPIGVTFPRRCLGSTSIGDAWRGSFRQ